MAKQTTACYTSKISPSQLRCSEVLSKRRCWQRVSHFLRAVRYPMGLSQILPCCDLRNWWKTLNITQIILLTYSGLAFLSPPLTTFFSMSFICLFRYSTSLSLSSSKMISKSRTGSTSPSTWVTSPSVNAPEKKRRNKRNWYFRSIGPNSQNLSRFAT